MRFSEAEYAILLQNQAEANPSQAPKPKRKRNPTSEAEIQKTCTQILQHDGWRALRTDPVSDRKRGKGFGEVGMPDYLYIRYSEGSAILRDGSWTRRHAEVLWIEYKKDGGTLSTEQLDWHGAERAKGALTLIAGVHFPASVEGFMEFYARSGLRRA